MKQRCEPHQYTRILSHYKNITKLICAFCKGNCKLSTEQDLLYTGLNIKEHSYKPSFGYEISKHWYTYKGIVYNIIGIIE